MAPYEGLRAWQLCHALVLKTYEITRSFPDHEKYGLVSQARRAAYSSAANIVEGSSKRGTAEIRRFLDITLGSLAELGYTFRLAHDLHYVTAADAEVVEQVRRHASIVTWRLYNSIRAGTPRSRNP